MDLIILGSSSAGNCYLFDNGKETLVVECGISFNEVEKAVGFDISRISGAIVSHEHGDHAKFVNKFLNARVPVYMSAGTMHKVCGRTTGFLPMLIESGKEISIGNYTVLPFTVEHDAAEPLGFLIYHAEMGITLFATDTASLRYHFAGLSNILLECNYSSEIMKRNFAEGHLSPKVLDRTIQSHCSLSMCRKILLSNDLSKVNNIVLIHLSSGNSNAEQFKLDITNATGKTVHVADRGMRITFNKSPF